jgi:hypothetical protein
MGNIKIGELPENLQSLDADLFETVNNAQSKKVTRKTLLGTIEEDITALENDTRGLSYTPGAVPPVQDRPDLNVDHMATANPIVMEGEQVIPTSAVEAELSHELITIGSFYKIFTESLRQLVPPPPTTDGEYKLVVSGGSSSWVAL